MVILDGNEVEEADIDPDKQRFLGMFRPPSPPETRFCPCGESFQIMGEDFSHWQKGHFDVPQYATIDSKGSHVKKAAAMLVAGGRYEFTNHDTKRQWTGIYNPRTQWKFHSWRPI